VDHIEEHLTAAEALMQRALDEPEVAESPVTTIFFSQNKVIQKEIEMKKGI
jgi:hypothetical protein